MDSPTHYVHWDFVLISVPNLVVIVLMLILFGLALVLPFPGRSERRGGQKDER